MAKTINDVYLQLFHRLRDGGDPQPSMTARELTAVACHADRAHTAAWAHSYLDNATVDYANILCDRVLGGEPLAYILGEWDFYGLTFRVDKSVLIPRADTEKLCELTIQQAKPRISPRILDLCCGSGCIGLAIASRVKDARITLADVSKEALAVAKRNIARNKLGGRMSTFQVDARERAPGFLGKFDMIVSNPPYITAEEMKQLPRSVDDYEPHLALFGGEDGLDFYRAIIENYTAVLKPEGFLCFEFGMGMGDAVCHLLEESDYTIIERKRDFNDRERAVLAQHGRKG